MEATELKAEDLKQGQFITVLRWTSHIDNSYCGDVLQVEIILLPFITVKRLNSRRKESFKLDTRNCKLAYLPMEYVDALTKQDDSEWPEEIG
jgi:hypothetical protein